MHDDIVQAHARIESKPDRDHRRKECSNGACAKLLDQEQACQDEDGDQVDPDCGNRLTYQ